MSREIEQDSDSFVRSLNPEVQTLERIVGEIASTGIPVLLAGESGTGKEVFALEIHRQSARHDEPLVKTGALRWRPIPFSDGCNPQPHQETAENPPAPCFSTR